MPGRRVLAVGVSEATWSRLLDPAFSPLPTFARLREEGARGVVDATSPLDSEHLWATAITGCTPGKHGIYSVIRRHQDGSFRPSSTTELAVPPVWRMFESAGRPAGTFNLALASHPEPSSGFMIARGMLPRFRRSMVEPAALFDSLYRKFGTWPMATSAKTHEEWDDAVPREVEQRSDVCLELLRTRPWDFALVQFVDVGRTQHRFWRESDEPDNRWHTTLRSVYAAVDRAIGRMIEAVPKETVVFVFSECGAGPIRYGVQLNAWLESAGYLARRSALRPAARIATGMARSYQVVSKLLPPAFNGFTESRLRRLKTRTKVAVSMADVDWSRTRAFSPGTIGQIFLNLAGRDPHGIVTMEERQDLVDEIRSGLLSLRDPDGRRAVERVIPQEQQGARQSLAPDLTVVWEDDGYMPAENYDERARIFVDWHPEQNGWSFTGSHRREGILLVRGDGIPPQDLGHVDLTDLVPTWLDLTSVPRPSHLDGTSFASSLFETLR